MKAPLASLRSRVFAATAAVAVLPVAVALAFATRQLGRQAEAGVVRGTRSRPVSSSSTTAPGSSWPPSAPRSWPTCPS